MQSSPRDTAQDAEHYTAHDQQQTQDQKDLDGDLLSTDGPFHNVIKIKPPLVFSCADADVLLSGLDAVLKTDLPKVGPGKPECELRG